MQSSPSAVKLAAVAIAGLALTACATGSTGHYAKGGGPGLSIGRSLLRSSNLDEHDLRDVFSPRRDITPALAPSDPWVGQIGITQRVSDASEFGCGIAVPGLSGGEPRDPALDGGGHDFGVGVWWKLDF